MILAGRHTYRTPTSDVTVFLIGMRANTLVKAPSVAWTVAQMPPMLKHLATHPDAGLLGYHMWFGRTTILLSYWESQEKLNAFARDQDAPHAKAWRDYVRKFVGRTDVGVWHETYVVSPGAMEGVYVNMPPFGLGKVLGTEPIERETSTAAQRTARVAA